MVAGSCIALEEKMVPGCCVALVEEMARGCCVALEEKLSPNSSVAAEEMARTVCSNSAIGTRSCTSASDISEIRRTGDFSNRLSWLVTDYQFSGDGCWLGAAASSSCTCCRSSTGLISGAPDSGDVVGTSSILSSSSDCTTGRFLHFAADLDMTTAKRRFPSKEHHAKHHDVMDPSQRHEMGEVVNVSWYPTCANSPVWMEVKVVGRLQETRSAIRTTMLDELGTPWSCGSRGHT
ncbi:unnamed protein product [Lampetra planeri]